MKKGKKTIIIIFVLAIIISLSACTSAKESYPPEASLDNEQIFLFNPFIYKLGIYDLESMEWNEIDAGGAFFQSFDWGNVYPYYIVGDHNNNFHAGKADDFSLNFNYYLDYDGAALAPLATDGELFLYLIERTDINPYLKRVVTISEKGEIELVANLDGMGIMSGVIIEGILYFVCYSEESDLYEIWSLDLTNDAQIREPVLIRNDYNTFRLYKYNGNLLYIDIENQLLYNEEINIKLNQKPDLVFLDDDIDILVEEYVNENNDLEMIFTEISTGKIIGTFVDAINFTYTDSVITIYGNGFIEHLDLPKGE